MVEGMAAMLSIDPMNPASALSQWSPSFSLYGFTVSTGAIAPGFIANQLGFGVIDLGSFAGLNFAFDPTSLAIQIDLMVGPPGSVVLRSAGTNTGNAPRTKPVPRDWDLLLIKNQDRANQDLHRKD
jgi:hypothetical protein